MQKLIQKELLKDLEKKISMLNLQIIQEKKQKQQKDLEPNVEYVDLEKLQEEKIILEPEIFPQEDVNKIFQKIPEKGKEV